MAALVWDVDSERTYETGLDHGILFVSDGSWYSTGVVWNGLTAVTVTPTGAEESVSYADNLKYFSLYSIEELEATIEAFDNPPEFNQCDGKVSFSNGVIIGQQNRKEFALAFRTVKGNKPLGNTYGHQLHILYGCKAGPSETAYATISDSPEPITKSWSITTTPVNMPNGNAPASHVIVDSTTQPTVYAALEELLIGTATTPSTLPTTAALAALV